MDVKTDLNDEKRCKTGRMFATSCTMIKRNVIVF